MDVGCYWFGSKLVPCWHVGPRNSKAAKVFFDGLADRLAKRVQLATDGHHPYLEAVEHAFSNDIDYARLIKIYGEDPSKERRYSPSRFVEAKCSTVTGNPDKSQISTSIVERQNLTMRMSMRRFTRLTNAFSKKVENHMYAISLHYMYYNFGRIHQSLRVTPAMESGVTDHVWSLEEIAGLVKDQLPKKRGPYKERISNWATRVIGLEIWTCKGCRVCRQVNCIIPKKKVKIPVSGKAKSKRAVRGKGVTPTYKRVIARISLRRWSAMMALAKLWTAVSCETGWCDPRSYRKRSWMGVRPGCWVNSRLF